MSACPWQKQSPGQAEREPVKWLASILRRTRRSTWQSIPRSRGLLVIPEVAHPPLHRVPIPLATTTLLLPEEEEGSPCNFIQGSGRSWVIEGQDCLGCS